MIDGGQAVDISELSERSLVKHLKKLFQSLNLEESGNHVFLLPTNVRPTLEVVMPIIRSQTQSEGYSLDTSKVLQDAPSVPPDVGCKDKVDDNVAVSCPREDSAGPKRRYLSILYNLFSSLTFVAVMHYMRYILQFVLETTILVNNPAS